MPRLLAVSFLRLPAIPEAELARLIKLACNGYDRRDVLAGRRRSGFASAIAPDIAHPVDWIKSLVSQTALPILARPMRAHQTPKEALQHVYD
jgi:hypothetical protein